MWYFEHLSKSKRIEAIDIIYFYTCYISELLPPEGLSGPSVVGGHSLHPSLRGRGPPLPHPPPRLLPPGRAVHPLVRKLPPQPLHSHPPAKRRVLSILDKAKLALDHSYGLHDEELFNHPE